MNPDLTRRRFLAAGGALVVGFSLSRVTPLAAEAEARLPGDLNTTPLLDAWIQIGADGKITVLTGKAELGRASRLLLYR